MWVNWASRFQLQLRQRPITHQSCCTERHQALPPFGFASPQTLRWREWKAELGSFEFIRWPESEWRWVRIGYQEYQENWHNAKYLWITLNGLSKCTGTNCKTSKGDPLPSFIAKEFSFDFFDVFETNLLLVSWRWKMIGLKATCTFLALQNI